MIKILLTSVCFIFHIGQQLMNEEYLVSKMYSSGFASYIELTKKAQEFGIQYPNARVKLYESNEMKQATQASSRSLTFVSSYKPSYTNQ